METMKKMEMIFIPSPGISHIVSMLEMAKLIIARDQRLSITIFLIKRPGDGTDANTDLSSFHNYNPSRIRFLHLREPNSDSIKHLNQEERFFASTGEIQIPIVREAIAAEVIGRPNSGNLVGILMDMFCACMIDVANEFNVPSYIYFTPGAACLGLMNHMQALKDEQGKDGSEFKNSDAQLDIPIFSHPYPARVLPLVMYDEAHGSTMLVGLTKKFNQSKGIVVNTFSDLESHAISVMSKNEKLPPIYPIGPLLNHKKSVGGDEHDEIMRWLDGQPHSSVVFLCFGSMGIFGEAQVKEIAVALERCRHRFLWSLRLASSDVPIKDVLPEGFLERTCEVGKVIGWAPQVEVLSHKAVGGFVSHCGWNSTLESLWCGVPMAAWPLYSEQQMNAFLLVKELELAVEVKMDHRMHFHGVEDEIVAASVIETAIRRLMDGDDDDHGRMRKRVKDMSQKGREALMEGGSSYKMLGRFIDDVILNATSS